MFPNLVGERFGKYHLLARLGAGEQWSIYKGYEQGGYDYVIVKLLHRTLIHDAAFMQRFEALPTLDHLNIEKVYDRGVLDGTPYLITEYVDGVSLAKERAARRLPFSLTDAVTIGYYMGQALSHIHAQGLHYSRLIPENILFTQDGQPILTDLDLALLLDAPTPPQDDIAALLALLRDITADTLPPALTEHTYTRGIDLSAALREHARPHNITPSAKAATAKQVTIAADTNHQFKAKPGVCPYQGLFAFREENAAFFFGREAFVDQLVELAQRKAIVMVTGASGSGKSSVVHAGLVPTMRQNWEVVDMRPGPTPIYALISALSPLLVTDLSPEERAEKNRRLAEKCRTGDATLTQLIEQIYSETGQRILLVIDQFEELYTLCEDDALRSRFLNILIEATDGPVFNNRLHIVLTLRADFLGQALAHRGFADILHQADLKLGPMNTGELMRAIENPAAKQGVTFEQGLVKRILRDVGDDLRTLPLLQFALTQLWREQEDGQLTHRAYEDINGAPGALARYADMVYQSLDADERSQARRVFMQLVRPGIGTEDTRRLANRSELDEDDWQLVQHLSDTRLVVIGRAPDGQETVEVVHEALIREWEQLRQWLNEDRAFRTWQDRLRTALHQWESSNRDQGAYLRGALLVEAEGWFAERDADLSPMERTFIRSSLARREQRKTEKRRAAQVKERNRRVTIGALAGGLIMALLLTAFSVQQAQNARQQQVVALSNQLAAQALSRLEGQEYELAHLLSLQAYNLNASAESLNAVLVSLQRSPYELVMRHYDSPVIAAVMTSHTRLLATLQADGTIELMDTRNRAVVSQITDAHTAEVTSITINDDHDHLASADMHGRIILWDITTPENPSRTQTIDTKLPVSSIAFSPDSDTLAAGHADGEVTMWELATATMRFDEALLGHTGDVRSIAFSPDGRWLASGSVNQAWAAVDEVVILWDVSTGQPYRLRGLETNVSDLAFNMEGQIVAAGTDGTIIMWDTWTRRRADITLTHDLEQQSTSVVLPELKIALNGTTLASGDINGTIILWDMETGRPLRDPLQSGAGTIHDLSFSEDGTTLISATQANSVIFWTMDQKLGASLTPLESRIWSISFLGEDIIAADDDGNIHIIDPITSEGRTINAHFHHINSLALHAGVTASASDDNTIRLWDAATGDMLTSPLAQHTDAVLDVAFSNDGALLASASRDDSIILWDMTTYQPVGHPLTGHTDDVWAIAFNPDDDILASASWDGTIRLWNVSTQSLLLPPLQVHDSPVISLAMSPTEPVMASLSRDGTIIIWNLTTSTPIHTIEQGRTGTTWQVAFSPDGQFVASAGCARLMARGSCERGEVRLWDVTTGQQIGQAFTGHQDTAWTIAFNPDGSTLASGSPDGSIILWDVNLQTWLSQACDLANRSLTTAEWQQYLGDEIYQPTCTP